MSVTTAIRHHAIWVIGASARETHKGRDEILRHRISLLGRECHVTSVGERDTPGQDIIL